MIQEMTTNFDEMMTTIVTMMTQMMFRMMSTAMSVTTVVTQAYRDVDKVTLDMTKMTTATTITWM